MKINNGFKNTTVDRIIFNSLFLFLILIIISIISLSVGSGTINFTSIFDTLLFRQKDEIIKKILFEIRLPRILLAVLVGGSLSLSGVVLQALLRNPLAEPFILGISGGASIGSIISIMIGFSLWYITNPVFSFAGASIVMVSVYFLGKRYGVIDSNILLLSGVMVGSFLSAIILFLVTMSGQVVKNALLWLLGNLSTANLPEITIIIPLIILSFGIIFLNSYKMNIISVSEESALHLGINVERVKKILLLSTSLLTGAVVSLSGTIGFIGLIVPHICRMIYGPDHRILVPTSFLVGAILMVVVDLISRTIIYPYEIPVGALTAVIGAPVFIVLLKKKK